MQIIRDKYYSARLWWLEYGHKIKYAFLEMIDPTPKWKRKESAKEYLDRVEVKYALRVSRYYYADYYFLFFRISYLGESIKNENKKEQRLWQERHDAIKEEFIKWDYYLTLAERRKFEEKHLRN